MRQGASPEEACKKTCERIIKKRGEKGKEVQVGFIALSNKGEFGGYAIQKGFTYAIQSKDGVKVYDSKSLY